jgi:hypothetical protein
MTVSMYTVSVPVFIQHLNGLNAVLDKAATWAAARKVNETDLLNMRLSPDMFNLARQVRAATDHAANAAGRLAGKELLKFANDESTIAQLKERITKTIDYLKNIKQSETKKSALLSLAVRHASLPARACYSETACQTSTFTLRQPTTLSGSAVSRSASVTSWAHRRHRSQRELTMMGFCRMAINENQCPFSSVVPQVEPVTCHTSSYGISKPYLISRVTLLPTVLLASRTKKSGRHSATSFLSTSTTRLSVSARSSLIRSLTIGQ